MARERTWRLIFFSFFLPSLTEPLSGLMRTCLHVCVSIRVSMSGCECDCTVCVCVCLSATHAACGSYMHCEDSAGSSASLVFARSRFPPTVGRQAGRQAGSVGCEAGIHWMVWVERRGKRTAIHGHIMLHSEQESCGCSEIFCTECLFLLLPFFDRKKEMS